MGPAGAVLGHELWVVPGPPIPPARTAERWEQCSQDGILLTLVTGREGCQTEGGPLPAYLEHRGGCPGSGGSSRVSFSLDLASQRVVREPVVLASPGHLFKGQTLSLFPDLLNVNLHFQEGFPHLSRLAPR